jgi:hypothetical protein
MRTEALPPDITDRDAFMALIFGFGINRSLFHEAHSWLGQMAGAAIGDALLPGPKATAAFDPSDIPLPLPRDMRPRLCRRPIKVPSVVPVDGTGRVVPMTRLEFAPEQAAGTIAAFPRHLYVPDEVIYVLDALDGHHTVRDLVGRAHAYPNGANVARMAEHLLGSLQRLGAIEGAA